MLPEVITTFITNEMIPVSFDAARVLYISHKGDVFKTLTSLREFEDNSRLVYRQDVEVKARELAAQAVLRARADSNEKRPAKPTPSIREIEAELLA